MTPSPFTVLYSVLNSLSKGGKMLVIGNKTSKQFYMYDVIHVPAGFWSDTVDSSFSASVESVICTLSVTILWSQIMVTVSFTSTVAVTGLLSETAAFTVGAAISTAIVDLSFTLDNCG